MPTRDGWKMTLTLSGTRATKTTPAAPAGRWRLRHSGSAGAVNLWIQRDETLASSGKPKPRRQSYFEDPGYQKRDAFGNYPLADTVPPGTPIRRNGSASAYAGLYDATGPLQAVGALETRRGGATQTAYYSGQFQKDDGRAPEMYLVDAGRQGQGTLCLGNGSTRLFRVSGTSVAAAIAAGEAAENWTPPATPAPASDLI